MMGAFKLRREGFSLIELMIAVTVLAVVTSSVLAVFTDQQQAYIGEKRMIDAQGDARLVGDMIFADLRMAGFMIPEIAGVTTGDGGSSAADRLCTSDPGAISDASLDAATGSFDGSSFTVALGAAEDEIRISVAQRDIDGDGAVDFSVGSGIIIADGTKSHCARITSMNSTRIEFTPDTPTGFVAAVATGVAVPAIIYEISGTVLTRNSLQISPQVEDLQIEFGVDADDDGALGVGEFPIHDLDGFDPAQIRTVRLSVLTRTSLEDEDLAASGPGRQAVANRAAAVSSDAFRRRLVTVTAAPRNML